MEKLPLVDQESAAPTRKLVAGTSTGIGIAVTLVPILFPALMQTIEALSPEFAAIWGPVLAAVVSAVMAVLGGSGVAYVVRNRAQPEEAAKMSDVAMKAAVSTILNELKK